MLKVLTVSVSMQLYTGHQYQFFPLRICMPHLASYSSFKLINILSHTISYHFYYFFLFTSFSAISHYCVNGFIAYFSRIDNTPSFTMYGKGPLPYHRAAVTHLLYNQSRCSLFSLFIFTESWMFLLLLLRLLNQGRYHTA